MSENASLTFQPSPNPPAYVSQIVKLLLRSPFHGLLSRFSMILTTQGRKTGKFYTIPITYLQEGDTVFCLTKSRWWKNLSDGAEVKLHLRGKQVKGLTNLIFQQSLIEEKIAQTIQMNARFARYFGVVLDDQNLPDPASLKLAATHYTLICIHLAHA